MPPTMQQLDAFSVGFKANMVFRQHQGFAEADKVGDGVCAALSYMWATEKLDRTYKLEVWRPGNPAAMFMGVPASTPMGRRFPQLTVPMMHVQRARRGAVIKQACFSLAGRTDVEAGFRELARQEGRYVGKVAHLRQGRGLGGQDIVEFITRYNDRLFQGYGLIGWMKNGHGHAVAFQAAGSLNQWYDANLGEFKFANYQAMSEMINVAWDVADYGCDEILLFTVYPKRR